MNHLHLKFHNEIVEDLDFQWLIANRLALIEITLENKYPNDSRVILSYSAIVKFLKSNSNVKQLNFINCSYEQRVELPEQLKNEWNIRINNMHYGNGEVKRVDMVFER